MSAYAAEGLGTVESGVRLLTGALRVGLASVFLLPTAVIFSACESTYGGYDVGGSAYYDVGLSDPWYYGGGYWDDDDIAALPDGRPGPPPRPAHPIARPPLSPRPMPSIPSRPRPSVRR